MGAIYMRKYRKGDSKVFSGRDAGIRARKEEKLAEKDEDDEVYDVIVPDDTYSLGSCFFGGMFSDSVIRLKEDRFREKYNFRYECSELSDLLAADVEEGINNALNTF